MKRELFTCLLAWALTTAVAGQSQPGANRVLGDVVRVDLAKREIVLNSASGEVIATFSSSTEFLQVEPGVTDLTNAKSSAINDIAPADRVLARGTVPADGKSIIARQIIVMKSSAISEKQKREREEWAKRGVGGTVTGIDPQKRSIAIKQHRRDGGRELVVETGEAATFLRYAPDSVKFSDAKTSSIDELQVGDELRALGQQSEDGSRVIADTVVFGSFRMAGGTIKSIDSKGEILIDDVPTRNPLTVVINSDSQLKQVPPELAQMLSRAGSGGIGPGERSGAGAEPQGTPPQRRGPGGMGPNGPDVARMMERMPSIALTDLKPGDFILVSSTKGTDPSRVTAITLLAGAEAILATRDGAGGAPDMNMGLAADIFDFGIGAPSN